MTANNLKSLQKILKSLSRDDLPYIFETWECLSNADIPTLVDELNVNLHRPRLRPNVNDGLRDISNLTSITLIEEGATKKKIVELICEACKIHGIHKKDLADLDLLSTQLHPERKRWIVYEIITNEDSNTEIKDPEVLCEKFGAQLSLLISHDLCMRMHNRAIWFRVGLKSRSKTGQGNAVFIVFHPHSPYFITTPIRQKAKEVIFQALIDMLQADDIQECPLSDKDLGSLQEMTLMKNAQGSFSKYRFNQVHTNPLVKTRGKKRKGSILDDLNIHIENENGKDDHRRQELTTDVFGSNPQPKLLKLEYKMRTQLRGRELAPSEEPFRCVVKFEGTNVIEGIKKLSQTGLASLPLPGHLANVHSMAKNRFLLTDKKES
ncbi:Centromere protein N [Holothuria leucospilota]|uniref:Centromere protein N n=1 Tax=Holothuria leucospilota TaxID=206669 RepID=A0A9Q1HCM6_HOLLE|nr:Centromere protein N [Holothuria leucospilota]